MAEHARRERAHALPFELLVHQLALAGERPAVNVQNENFLPQLLRELGLAVQVVYLAVFVGEVCGIDGV